MHAESLSLQKLLVSCTWLAPHFQVPMPRGAANPMLLGATGFWKCCHLIRQGVIRSIFPQLVETFLFVL